MDNAPGSSHIVDALQPWTQGRLPEKAENLIQALIPLVTDLDDTMSEIARRMPTASHQLARVTKATEMATHEIINRTDAILASHQSLTEDAGAEETHIIRFQASLSALKRHFEQAGLQEATMLGHLEQLHTAFQTELANRNQQDAHIQETRSHISQIVLSLQVQDITTQQVASVNHVLQAIRDQLLGLLDRLGAPLPQLAVDDDLLESGQAFDHRARYDHNPSRQQQADKITEFMASEGAASADEITKLFGG